MAPEETRKKPVAHVKTRYRKGPLAMHAFQPGQTYEIPDGKQEGIDHFSHAL